MTWTPSTARIADRVQREGRVFITTTELDGRSVLRACIVNFRTTDADLDALIDAIVSSARRLPLTPASTGLSPGQSC